MKRRLAKEFQPDYEGGEGDRAERDGRERERKYKYRDILLTCDELLSLLRMTKGLLSRP